MRAGAGAEAALGAGAFFVEVCSRSARISATSVPSRRAETALAGGAERSCAPALTRRERAAVVAAAAGARSDSAEHETRAARLVLVG